MIRIILLGGIELQQRFNDLMKQDVKPFLFERGFTKKGLNFNRKKDDLIYMFNFQKSAGNSADSVMFYVNCGIYAAELAQIQSKELLVEPKEAECHFRTRIGDLAGHMPDRFAIHSDTCMNDLKNTLLGGLDEAIHVYDTMTSARSIVDYYMSGPYLHLGEESFHLLLQDNEIATAKRYLKDLQKKYGAENRWTIFENKYRAIFHAFGVEFDAL